MGGEGSGRIPGFHDCFTGYETLLSSLTQNRIIAVGFTLHRMDMDRSASASPWHRFLNRVWDPITVRNPPILEPHQRLA